MAVSYDYVLKQGDTKPALQYVVVDATGSPINLTGCSVNFVMRALTAQTPVVDQAATILNASAGLVSYELTTAQSAIAGGYMGSFVVTFGDGSTQTSPLRGYLEIMIEENLTSAGGAQLVSLAEVKDHLSIPAGDTDRDAEILRMMTEVVPVIEHICGPIFLRTVDEFYDGGRTVIELRKRPAARVIAATEFHGPVPFELDIVEDAAHGTTYCIQFEPPGRVVRRTVGGGTTTFPPGLETVHMVYEAGRQTVEPNITSGTKELIRIRFTKTQRGRPAVGGADALDEDEPGQEILGFYVPKSVREQLEPSARPPGIA